MTENDSGSAQDGASLLCVDLCWNDSVGLGRGVSRCREWVRAVWCGAVAGLSAGDVRSEAELSRGPWFCGQGA